MGDDHFAVAIEQQNKGIDAGILSEIDPSLGANVQAKSVLPDLTMRYRNVHDRGHWQIAGVRARVCATRRAPRPATSPAAPTSAGGVKPQHGVSARTERDTIKLQVVMGEGIASFMNDGGSNLAPHDGKGEAVPLTGVVVGIDHGWTEQWISDGRLQRQRRRQPQPADRRRLLEGPVRDGEPDARPQRPRRLRGGVSTGSSARTRTARPATAFACSSPSSGTSRSAPSSRTSTPDPGAASCTTP